MVSCLRIENTIVKDRRSLSHCRFWRLKHIQTTENMRNTRDVLEVVCGVIELEENIISEKDKEQIPSDCKHICHNVFRVTDYIVSLKTEAQISKHAKSIVANNLDVIMCAQNAVLRCYSLNEAFSGSAFLLGPEILGTNWHVINATKHPIYFSNSTDLMVDSFKLHLEAVETGFATLM
jgi:hypothetical protein